MIQRFVLAAVMLAGAQVCLGQAASATQPAAPVKTGEVDLTFTDRSPLSTPKELARRLTMKESDLKDDYDLSKCPFKAYIPPDYDPATPCGVIVYLGYKDTTSTPPLWQPVLQKSHLIFIAPVCHSGSQYAPSVPIWQTTGLAMDAIYNLKRQYAVDDHRIYLMTWEDGTRVDFATPDLFTGFIETADINYFMRVTLPGGNYFDSHIPRPDEIMFHKAQDKPFIIIVDASVPLSKTEGTAKAAMMKRSGFSYVTTLSLSLSDDLHYPNLKADWFEQEALPFLDKGSAAATTQPATAPATPAVSQAEHYLAQGQLYLKNGQTDLARRKLQEVIDFYPNVPAAAKARELLDQMKNQ